MGESRESGKRVLQSYGRIERTCEIKNVDKENEPSPILRENRGKVGKGFSDPTGEMRESRERVLRSYMGGSREKIKLKKT